MRPTLLFAAPVIALALSGCNPPGQPQAQAPQNPCQAFAGLVEDEYATPEAREMALEYLRAHCLGLAPAGSPLKQ